MNPRHTEDAFTDVIVIYNPNSTGSGREMAEELRETVTKYQVRLVKTAYAGHAEKLAFKFAKGSSRPLIISASGDGGYHEVINGILRAQAEGAQAVAGLLPAGNANDHFREVHDEDLSNAITNGNIQKIDVLRLRTTVKGKTFERYAHSYIGLGLTPNVGKALNQTDLHWYNEIAIVVKSLLGLHSIKLVNDGQSQRYYSLVFSNVSKMSKVLQLAKDASTSDGKFEVTIFKRHNKIRLIRTLLKASTIGLAGMSQSEPYAFKTIVPTMVQLDGEIATIDAKAAVTVDLEPGLLPCIV